MPTTRSQTRRARQIGGRRDEPGLALRAEPVQRMAQEAVDPRVDELRNNLARFIEPDYRTDTALDQIRFAISSAALDIMAHPREGTVPFQAVISSPVFRIEQYRRTMFGALYNTSLNNLDCTECAIRVEPIMEELTRHLNTEHAWQGPMTAQFAAGVMITFLDSVLRQGLGMTSQRQLIQLLIIDSESGLPQLFLRSAMQVCDCEQEILAHFAGYLRTIAASLRKVEPMPWDFIDTLNSVS